MENTSFSMNMATQAHWKNMPLLTYTDNSLQCPAEINTSKTPTTCIPFHTNYDYRGRLSINKDYYLKKLLL